MGGLQPPDYKALSRGIIGKSAPILAEIAVRKSQVNTLPKGGVFLCYAKENTRQRKILARVGETFREQGHAVKSMSIGEVYKTTPNF
jgi:hypothetical protein